MRHRCPGRERIDRRSVDEAVIGQHRESRLRLDRSLGVDDEEYIQLRIEAAGDREDPIRRCEVDDLRVFESIDS